MPIQPLAAIHNKPYYYYVGAEPTCVSICTRISCRVNFWRGCPSASMLHFTFMGLATYVPQSFFTTMLQIICSMLSSLAVQRVGSVCRRMAAVYTADLAVARRVDLVVQLVCAKSDWGNDVIIAVYVSGLWTGLIVLLPFLLPSAFLLLLLHLFFLILLLIMLLVPVSFSSSFSFCFCSSFLPHAVSLSPAPSASTPGLFSALLLLLLRWSSFFTYSSCVPSCYLSFLSCSFWSYL